MGRKRLNSSDEESKKENQADKSFKALKNSATANSRERARMQVLSKAFVKLKTTLPWVPPDTKLSKLDTLRLATSYIAHLRQILADDDAAMATASQHSPGDSAGDSDGAESTPGSTDTARSPQPGSAAGVHPINFTWPYSFHGKVTAHPDPSLRSPDRPDAHGPTAKLPSMKTLSCQTFT